MIKGQAARVGVVLLGADGSPIAGVTPTVEIKVDATAWKATTNAASVSDAKGRTDVLLDAGETIATDLQIFWEGTGAIVILQSIPGLIDPAAFKADVSSIPAIGGAATFRQLRDGADQVLQEVKETLTATEQNP